MMKLLLGWQRVAAIPIAVKGAEHRCAEALDCDVPACCQVSKPSKEKLCFRILSSQKPGREIDLIRRDLLQPQYGDELLLLWACA